MWQSSSERVEVRDPAVERHSIDSGLVRHCHVLSPTASVPFAVPLVERDATIAGVGKLNLVVLRSADIEAARSFYECFDMSFQRHRHGQGPAHYAAERDDIVLEIYPAAGQGEPDSAGLGFVVADLRATAARLCDAGHTPGEISTHVGDDVRRPRQRRPSRRGAGRDDR